MSSVIAMVPPDQQEELIQDIIAYLSDRPEGDGETAVA
jgi:hypothetical protein